MGSIAERTVAAVFTHAKVVLLRFFNGKDVRREFSSRVRTVAEWLLGRLAASAECIVFTGFKFNGLRAASGNFRWVTHDARSLLLGIEVWQTTDRQVTVTMAPCFGRQVFYHPQRISTSPGGRRDCELCRIDPRDAKHGKD